MKTAPIMAEMARHPAEFEQLLVHTGQHYDFEMSEVFFRHLDMPTPQRFLNVGSGSHAKQTARIMIAGVDVTQVRVRWVVPSEAGFVPDRRPGPRDGDARGTLAGLLLEYYS